MVRLSWARVLLLHQLLIDETGGAADMLLTKRIEDQEALLNRP